MKEKAIVQGPFKASHILKISCSSDPKILCPKMPGLPMAGGKPMSKIELGNGGRMALIFGSLSRSCFKSSNSIRMDWSISQVQLLCPYAIHIIRYH